MPRRLTSRSQRRACSEFIARILRFIDLFGIRELPGCPQASTQAVRSVRRRVVAAMRQVSVTRCGSSHSVAIAVNELQPTPTDGSAERWAYDYVSSCDLAYKLMPPPLPSCSRPLSSPCVLDTPGRPRELRVELGGHKRPGPQALRDPARRARL